MSTLTLTFNIHDSYSDCELCGSYSNDIVSVKSESHEAFGEFSTGTSAHCYDMEEADYALLVEEVFSRLERIGCAVPRPEWNPQPKNEELEARYKAAITDRGLDDVKLHPTWGTWPKDTDWNTYWEYDNYRSKDFEDSYYEFYEYSMDLSNPNSFVSYLQRCGIEINIERTEDERYDVNDLYDDDYYDDEEE